VRLGLVRRRRDPADRRRMALQLTALAEGKLASLSVGHREELRRLSGPLGSMLTALH
jgi:DNA-binding MarR family transcriptional regulator